MIDPGRSRPAHLQILAVSWNFGWPVAAGVVLGHWIDGHLGSSPAATLVLGIGAMAAAAWRLIGLSRQESIERRQEEADEAEELRQHPPEVRRRHNDTPEELDDEAPGP